MPHANDQKQVDSFFFFTGRGAVSFVQTDVSFSGRTVAVVVWVQSSAHAGPIFFSGVFLKPTDLQYTACAFDSSQVLPNCLPKHPFLPWNSSLGVLWDICESLGGNNSCAALQVEDYRQYNGICFPTNLRFKSNVYLYPTL